MTPHLFLRRDVHKEKEGLQKKWSRWSKKNKEEGGGVVKRKRV